MKRWLVKTEAETYSAAELERDQCTVWDGVRNPQAQGHLHSMSAGDEVFVYHTGDQKAIVATATVASAPRPDPGDKSGKSVAVELKFGGWLSRPVTLAEIKSDPLFADFALVRQSRLSVMPVTDAQWKRLVQIANRPAQ